MACYLASCLFSIYRVLREEELHALLPLRYGRTPLLRKRVGDYFLNPCPPFFYSNARCVCVYVIRALSLVHPQQRLQQSVKGVRLLDINFLRATGESTARGYPWHEAVAWWQTGVRRHILDSAEVGHGFMPPIRPDVCCCVFRSILLMGKNMRHGVTASILLCVL